jgi:hypothetical protein
MVESFNKGTGLVCPNQPGALSVLHRGNVNRQSAIGKRDLLRLRSAEKGVPIHRNALSFLVGLYNYLTLFF